MSEKTARKLRRQQTEEHIPEFNRSFGMNRKMRRQRTIDRSFTAKGYTFGRKIGGVQEGKINHLVKIQGKQ